MSTALAAIEFLVLSGSVFEAPAFVAGFDDIAMNGQAIEQGRSYPGVAEDAWPFTEVKVGGDDHRGLLIKMADQMEQQLAAGLSEGEVAELVEDDEVQSGKPIGETTLSLSTSLGLELVDQVNDVEEASAVAVADA